MFTKAKYFTLILDVFWIRWRSFRDKYNFFKVTWKKLKKK